MCVVKMISPVYICVYGINKEVQLCVDGRLLCSVFRHLTKVRRHSNMCGVRVTGELEKNVLQAAV